MLYKIILCSPDSKPEEFFDNVNRRNNEGRTLLSFAASGGSRDIIKILLEKYPEDAHVPDIYGRTPLHWTIDVDRDGSIEELLKHSTDSIHKADNAGRTPLYMAARRSNLAITQLIEEAIKKRY